MPHFLKSALDVTDERIIRHSFPIIVVTSVVSIGLLSAFLQISLTILLFAKHGAIFIENNNYSFSFLSDALRTNTVLANAWSLSFVPSLTMLLCVLTSYFRSENRIWRWRFTYFANTITHLGLLSLIFFDNVEYPSHHCFGVIAAVNGFLCMHLLVIHSDWDMLRLTWHPSMIFDSLLVIFAGVSVIVFGTTFLLLPYKDAWTSWTEYDILVNVSVIAEWVLLVVLMVMQLNLPARAVRIALYVAESDTSFQKGF